MRRATRSAFKIVLRPAGERAQKNAPPCGGANSVHNATLCRKERSASQFPFCPDGSTPSLRQTAARRCRPTPARASSTGRSGAEQAYRGWKGRPGYPDSRGFTGVVRAVGTLPGYPVCRGSPAYPGCPAAPGDRGCPVCRAYPAACQAHPGCRGCPAFPGW